MRENKTRETWDMPAFSTSEKHLTHLTTKIHWPNVSSGEIQKLRRKFQSEKMSVHLPETYRNKKCLVRNGFLQGSVFGPYHFLLHINDLSSVCENAQVALFAGHSSLI